MIDEVELGRLNQVKEFLTIDFRTNKELPEITDLASQICEKPISLITLLDDEINWIKAATGTDLSFSRRDTSFCQHAIKSDELFIINDATEDARFNNNPLVYEQPGVRFFASAPLITKEGFRLGSLCVFDVKPNNLTDVQKMALQVLSKQVVYIFETELAKSKLKEQRLSIESKNDALRAIAQLQSHDIRHPLTSIMALVNLANDDVSSLNKDWLDMLRDVAQILDSRIHAIVGEALGNKDIKLLRYNKMVEDIEDYAILLLNPDGIIENWNKGAEKIKGYTPAEIIGKNFSVFYTQKQKNYGLPQKLIEIARTNGVARNEGIRVKKDGSTFFAKVTITAIYSEQGEILGFTKVTRDISKDNHKPNSIFHKLRYSWQKLNLIWQSKRNSDFPIVYSPQR